MYKRFSLLFLLFLALARTAAAAPEQWVEVRSAHFTVITDAGEKQGRHLLDQFERMRWVFHTMFPNMNTDPSNPIQVFAAKNAKSFEALEPAVYLGKGQLKLAGLFMRTEDRNYVLLRLDASDEEHPYATVYHEYTHLLLASAQEWMPLWLNEGLAEFFQNTTIRNKDVSLGQASRENLLYLRENGIIPLPVLLKVDAKSPYYHEENKGGIFYAESWALTHMIQINDQMNHTHRLRDYGILLMKNEDSVTAAEHAFGDLKKLQAELEYYIHSSMYREFTLNSAAAAIDESSYTATVLPQPQADAARADVMASVGRIQDAHTLLESVLKADPSNAPARETLGMIALREHNDADALKWYSEAVKLDSKSYLAHYYFAQISMNDRDADRAVVESSLRQAIDLNPSFAPAYNQLAMLYGMHREHLDEAQKLIVKAIQLDPTQIVFRLNAAGILTEVGDFAGAQRVAENCVKIARTPQEAAMAQSRVDQLRQIETVRAQQAAHPVVTTIEDNSPRVVDVVKEEPPKHPTEPPTGPKHSFEGVMRQVSCSYPSVLEFKLEGAKKTVAVYSNNFLKIDLSAIGFTPSGTMDPCHDFEGRKARIQYAEVSDKTVDGQVIAIELHK